MNNNTQPTLQNIPSVKSSFWLLTGQKAIVIPIIQRDYAQGRVKDDVRQIRESFLKKIFSALETNGSMELDFVYGSLEKPKSLLNNGQSLDEFTPLDGQQRLTTLFLLHWFLAIWNVLDYEMFKNHVEGRFSYRTRTSSSLFCERLIKYKCPYVFLSQLKKEGGSISISQQLMEEGWFHNQWKYDPTIIGMLNMLDSMAVEFLSYTEDSDSADKAAKARIFFERLTSSVDLCPITFNLLYLNQGDFHLSDELYIKMNSRGKPLSDFETFKARFETFLNTTSFRENFSRKIDGEWADAFWKIRNEVKPNSKKSDKNYYRDNTDGMMMNLIKFILANEYALIADDNDNGLDELFESKVAQKQNPNIRLTFYRYTELGVLCDNKDDNSKNKNDKIANAIFNTFQLVFEILDGRNNNNNIYELDCKFVNLDIYEYLQNVLFYDIDGKNDSGYTIISYDVRLILWSYFAYCIKFKDKIVHNKRELNRWMRFIRNMVESVEINSANDMQKAINYLYSILNSFEGDIVAYLVNNNVGSILNCTPFPKTQIREEILKANIISNCILWESKINDADNVDKWPGRSGYLFYFIGLTSPNKHPIGCAHHKSTIDRFVQYKSKMDKLIPYMDKENNVIFERALLTKHLEPPKDESSPKVYYMRPEKEADSITIYSLMDQSIGGRSYSWRQMIQYNGIDNDDSVYKAGVDCLKELLDDPLFDESNVENSLEEIIEKGKRTIDDWRWPLLDMPKLWGESKQRFIRISNDNKYAWVPKEKEGRTNHYETWAYHLLQKISENNKDNKYKYIHNKYNKDVTLDFNNLDFNNIVNKYQLKISHTNNNLWKFEMVAVDKEGNSIDPKDLPLEKRAFIFGLMPNNDQSFYKETEEYAILWAIAMQKCIGYYCKIE